MRVAFDSRMIDHPGIGTYIRNLLMAMLPKAGPDEFILFGTPNKVSGFKNCTIHKYTTPVYHLREFFYNPFKKIDADVIHIPHFNVPFHKINKLVVTMHDIIYLKFSGVYSSPILRPAVRLTIANAIRRASGIIAVSENTRNDIIEYFPYAKDKIKVIYEAADPVFKKIDDYEKKEYIRKKYNLPNDIMLFVGALKKHKNIERLIDAYIGLRSKGISHRLVIIGRYRPKEVSILYKIRSSDAIYVGEVPREDLAIIYNLATLFVMPSLYEGFGLPAIEAMACGVPVAASSVASLPEVVADAAALFNPYDIDDISKTLYNILADEAARYRLSQNGIRRAAEFSWQKAAEETLALYRKLIS